MDPLIPVEEASTRELVQELVDESKRMLQEEKRLLRLEAQRIRDEADQMVAEARVRVRNDLALAKAELKDKAKHGARAGGIAAAGGILLHAALYLLLFAIVFGLARVMPLWAAALLVGGVTAAGGAALGWRGVEGFKKVDPAPRSTINHIKGDGRWMSERMHALKSRIHVGA